MPNYAKRPVRYDQSRDPRRRVPSRDAERGWWEARKAILLPLIEQGLSSAQIAQKLTLSPSQIRANYQRLYNELELPKRNRNPVLLIRTIYARGWLPCPCGRKDHATTEELAEVGEPEAG
jgi:DNA-binding NarL/FixJ family response regulator